MVKKKLLVGGEICKVVSKKGGHIPCPENKDK